VSLFSFIGADPASAWLSGCAALDDRGFILTDRSLTDDRLDERWRALGRGPLLFETSRPGLFAVGDVRSGSMKRVAAAVGEGSAAVRSVHDHLALLPAVRTGCYTGNREATASSSISPIPFVLPPMIA
jgi:thioredoxin reductase (NADPH)